MNPLSFWTAWRARRRASRALREAERRRAVIMAQIAERKAHRLEWVPKLADLRRATAESLRAGLVR